MHYAFFDNKFIIFKSETLLMDDIVNKIRKWAYKISSGGELVVREIHIYLHHPLYRNLENYHRHYLLLVHSVNGHVYVVAPTFLTFFHCFLVISYRISGLILFAKSSTNSPVNLELFCVISTTSNITLFMSSLVKCDQPSLQWPVSC